MRWYWLFMILIKKHSWAIHRNVLSNVADHHRFFVLITFQPIQPIESNRIEPDRECIVLYRTDRTWRVAFVCKHFVDWCVVRLLLIGSWFQLVRLSDGYHVLMRFCSELVYITRSIEWKAAHIERDGHCVGLRGQWGRERNVKAERDVSVITASRIIVIRIIAFQLSLSS